MLDIYFIGLFKISFCRIFFDLVIDFFEYIFNFNKFFDFVIWYEFYKFYF